MNNINNRITKLRTSLKMSQEQFASLFEVTKQSVQKWESGETMPELGKLIQMSKKFNISLDSLVVGSNNRTSEGSTVKSIEPPLENLNSYESYSSYIMTEYMQSYEEGKDIEPYKDVFQSIANLPHGKMKEKLCDVLYTVVMNCPQRSDYKYIEPSDLEEIKLLRRPHEVKGTVDKSRLESKIHGAWMGRICGCMLGRTIEGIKTNELIPFLTETGNYPMKRYIYKSDINDEICKKYEYPFSQRFYADALDYMICDDDLNYVVLGQRLIDKYSRDFCSRDVSWLWLDSQGKCMYCTAERVAYHNFVAGFLPPESAIYKNPFREWIGAQIRGDYFGYINPGDPEKAAEMAYRDACISHVKNGIYGELFVAAALAVAAVTDNIEDIILGSLAQIPYSSRFYEAVMRVLENYKNGMPEEEAYKLIHDEYDEYTEHGWCHTLSNAMVVTASLLYGGGDYSRSICLAVQTGFDTDCNGATVGSILGMANGLESIPEYWGKRYNDKLETSIFEVGTVKISDCVKRTIEHIEQK
ncbi:MAG: ADP-ribosylglycohydrolase family protein [Oscillospiraceae bacterium]|nr:MAG: ADP-ribosylglycohydrolase family protein [Oscillospiraceae bacterium]